MHHYISYSSVDAQDFALTLANSLVSSNPTIPIWIDKLNLHHGDWDEQIDQAIRTCESLIFIMTHDSVESPVCKNEIHLAFAYKKPIIPVRLHADVSIPFRLNSHQYIDFGASYQDGLARLRHHLLWLTTDEGRLHSLMESLQYRRRDLARASVINKTSIEQEIEELQIEIRKLKRIIQNPINCSKELTVQGSLSSDSTPKIFTTPQRSQINQALCIHKAYVNDKEIGIFQDQEPDFTSEQSNEKFIQKIPDHYTSSSKNITSLETDHSIFICHAPEDRNIADAICSKLERNNIKCWVAPRDIHPGERFAKSILNALDDSKIIIIVFSHNSDVSSHVRSEIEHAVQKKKLIIPFIIEEVQPSREMQYLLAPLHGFDAKNIPLDNSTDTLTQVIQKQLAQDEAREKPQNNQKQTLFRDIVECTVFSPPIIALETSILVQIFAHVFTDEDAVKTMAKEFDQDTARRSFTTLTTQLIRGSLLSFHLEMDGLYVTSPVQMLVWWGRPASVNFKVTASKSSHIGNHIGTVIISQNSVPIGHIQFKITVTAAPEKPREYENEPTGDAVFHYKTAFVSYSHTDRHEVLKRLQIPSILHQYKIRQDILSLEPGDIWEPKLLQYIDECDLFLLFWSTAAKQSEMVQKEIRYALQKKQGNDLAPPKIIPVLIEGPPPVSPPEELLHIHFNDYRTYFSESEK
jgi:hypothetical protein